MLASRLAWAGWALVPVALLSYHYGPGQDAFQRDCAAGLHADARAAEQAAEDAQSRAYDAHLDGIEARRKAFFTESPADEELAADATAREQAAYLEAAAAWESAADLLGTVQDTLGDADPEASRDLRLARARALVRSGDVWTGIEELEGFLSEEEGPARTDEDLAAREELATAYYYGARLLRLAGVPQQDWRVESTKARQNFRFLAEATRSAGGADEEVERHERNVELVLNLEQTSLDDVQGRPLPKQSPCVGTCKMEKRNGLCKGKKPAPPRNKKDGRGAGGAEAIRTGW